MLKVKMKVTACSNARKNTVSLVTWSHDFGDKMLNLLLQEFIDFS